MTKSIRFKAGMTVKINSEYTGIRAFGVHSQSLDQFDYKKGDNVELLKYDSADETWHVKAKGKVSIWIKRKNLAPITEKAKVPESSPFKVGDKVELINKDADWASNDNVTTGVTYTVTDVTIASAGQIEPYITVSGGSARGTYWIACKNFKLYKQPKATPKVMQAVCINPGSYNSRITKGQIYNVQEAPSIGDDKFYKVLNPNDGKDSFNCWQERFKVITEPVTETPKTVVPKAEAPKKRMAVCIDMSDSPAPYTVGQVYEIKREDDKHYFFKSHPDNGGMYKWRFKEIVDKVAEQPIPKSEYSIKVVCLDNSGYTLKLTIGKTYMAKPSTNKGEDDLYMIETDDRGGEAGETIVFMKRFTVVKDEPKVGDTISAQWLNTNTPKYFHGYTNGWRSEVITLFGGDRKIQKIEEKDGRIAALISGTSDIWIDMAELTKETEAPDKRHVIPDIAKEVPAPVMGMFLMELTTLIEKYK